MNIFLDNNGFDLTKTVKLIGEEIIKRAPEIAGDPTDLESIDITACINADSMPELAWEKRILPNPTTALKKKLNPPITADEPEYGG